MNRTAPSPVALLVLLLALLADTQAQAQNSTPASKEDNAVSFHEARVAARPDDAAALRFLANAYIARAEATGEPADYDRAWQVLDRAEKLEPGDPATVAARARVLLSRHRFPQARAVAEEGLKRYPNDEALLAAAGDATREIGDLEAAEKFYNKLHAQAPRLISWARLAHVAELRGNLNAAATMLEKAMEAGTKKAAPAETIAWCHAVLGEIELKRGKLEAARKQYRAGLERSPDHPLVLEHLAELETKQGNLPAAEAVYQRILAQRDDPNVRLRVAELLERHGKREDAGRIREEVTAVFERLVEAGNEGYLRPLAELDLAAGRYQRAATLAARDVALRPTEESQDLLRKVLAAAAASGKPVNGFADNSR